jgi:hypothetical protein
MTSVPTPRELLESTIETDRRVAGGLDAAARALRVGCDRLEVAEILEQLAAETRISIARREELR